MSETVLSIVFMDVCLLLKDTRLSSMSSMCLEQMEAEILKEKMFYFQYL